MRVCIYRERDILVFILCKLKKKNSVFVLSDCCLTKMMMLVDCSGCRTPLQLPPGAKTIRCAVCHAVTRVAPPPAAPAPYLQPTPQYYPPRPSSYNHPPPPSVHGRKRAVIIGISYRNTRNELKGCINDAKCMRYLLVNRFKFPSESILMLTGKLWFGHSCSLS